MHNFYERLFIYSFSSFVFVVAVPYFFTTMLAARFAIVQDVSSDDLRLNPVEINAATVSPAPVTSKTSLTLNAGSKNGLSGLLSVNKAMPSEPLVMRTFFAEEIFKSFFPAFMSDS